MISKSKIKPDTDKLIKYINDDLRRINTTDNEENISIVDGVKKVNFDSIAAVPSKKRLNFPKIKRRESKSASGFRPFLN